MTADCGMPYLIRSLVFSCSLFLYCSFSCGQNKPPVEYPEPTASYLKRIQQGDQSFGFNGSKEVVAWQKNARAALVELLGLGRMAAQLGDFDSTVILGETEEVDGKITRTLGSIEVEPGIRIPFYLLVPKSGKAGERFPLLICPHGHDVLGHHSYAGAFRNDAHRKKILERGGNIAEQAARRGFIAIAPATRGLAKELTVPDLNGRHGNRACRAQLMHCLIGGRTPIGERVWDMQRLLDWAEKHPQVDKDRIVMTGNSGGGVTTAYTAAIDLRIRVAIPSCSFTSATSEGGYIFHCDCCLVPGLRNWGDWAEIGGLVAPRRLLIVHGVKDGLHRAADVEKNAAAVAEIYRAAGVAHQVSLQWGKGGHRFYPELMWPFIDAPLK